MSEDSSDELDSGSISVNTSPESRKQDASADGEDITDPARRLPSLRHLGLLKALSNAAEHSAPLGLSPVSNFFTGFPHSIPPPSPRHPFDASYWMLAETHTTPGPSGLDQSQQEDSGSRSSSPMNLSSREGSHEPIVVGAWPGSPLTRAESPSLPAPEPVPKSPSIVELSRLSPASDPRSPLLKTSALTIDIPADDEVVEIPRPSMLMVENSMDFDFSERFDRLDGLLVNEFVEEEASDRERERESSPLFRWSDKLPEQTQTQPAQTEGQMSSENSQLSKTLSSLKATARKVSEPLAS